MKRLCPHCGQIKPLTSEFWYIQRARENHPTPGWESYCRECWKDINKANKLRRKTIKLAQKLLNVGLGFQPVTNHTSAHDQSEKNAKDVEGHFVVTMQPTNKS